MFKRNNKTETTATKKDVFAVHHGDHAGKLFVIVEVTNDTVSCLTLPDMENIHIPLTTFERGRKTDIIKYVEKLSNDIFHVTKAQYKKNKE
tara:strand:+ start:179 stop:451 length:273 start_codon:yes stop_codon:yes gene_type:complete